MAIWNILFFYFLNQKIENLLVVKGLYKFRKMRKWFKITIISTFMLFLPKTAWKNMILSIFSSLLNPFKTIGHIWPINTVLHSNARNFWTIQIFRRIRAFLETRGNLQSFESNPGFVAPIFREIWPFEIFYFFTF